MVPGLPVVVGISILLWNGVSLVYGQLWPQSPELSYGGLRESY